MRRQQQSPINLRKARFVRDLGTGLEINWHRGPQAFTPEREKHGFRFAARTENTVRLEGDRYTLSQVHFHRPSEHWVEGRRYEAELHAVHGGVDDGIRRCAVAVFLELPAAGSRRVDPRPPRSIDLAALLPERRTFYRYEGSLTTPEHDEIVSWVVFKHAVTVTAPDLAAFVHECADEARDPQPLHRRFVLTGAQG